jgi:hypothetical protein
LVQPFVGAASGDAERNGGHVAENVGLLRTGPRLHGLEPIMGRKIPRNFCACGCGTLVRYNYKRGHKRDHVPRKKPDAQLFVWSPGTKRNCQAAARYRELRKAAGTYCCDICKIIEWLGQPVPIVADHINGDSSDNRFSNFRLLCRNCDGQQDTYCGRNRGRAKKHVEDLEARRAYLMAAKQELHRVQGIPDTVPVAIAILMSDT